MNVTGLWYLDFGLYILRSLPSKSINWKYVSESEKENNSGDTLEEANMVVNGFEIARGLGALAYVSNKKTQREILQTLSLACFGEKPWRANLDACLDEIRKQTSDRSQRDTGRKYAIRMFFEQRDVHPIDPMISQMLDAIFLEQGLRDDETRHVLQEINYATDPTGAATKARINKEMENVIQQATFGTVKNVIRSDQAPDWRARFCTVLAGDESFQFKHGSTNSAIVEEKYFYSTPDKKPESRTKINALRAVVFVRKVKHHNCKVYEIQGVNDDETMVIFVPTDTRLSYNFLPNLTAHKLVKLLPPSDASFEIEEVCIPKFDINFSTSLRSIFNKKSSALANFFNRSKPLTIPRMFCPYKADFGKIIGIPNSTASCLVFPLYDFYYKAKCALSMLPDEQAQQDPANHVELPPTTSQPHVQVKAMKINQGPNNNVNVVTLPAEMTFMVTPYGTVYFLGHFKLSKPFFEPLPSVDQKPDDTNNNKPPEDKKKTPIMACKVPSPSPAKSLKPAVPVEHQRSDRVITPIHEMSIQKEESSKQGKDNKIHSKERSLPRVPSRVVAGIDPPSLRSHQNGVGNLRRQRSVQETSVNRPPVIIPMAEENRSKTLEYVPTNVRDDIYDPSLEMVGDNVINTPFLFMVFTKIENDMNDSLRAPVFIGRFTNIEEVKPKQNKN